MLIAALFTLAKAWTQAKGSSMDEWKNMWYIDTHNDISPSYKKGRNLAIMWEHGCTQRVLFLVK